MKTAEEFLNETYAVLQHRCNVRLLELISKMPKREALTIGEQDFFVFTGKVDKEKVYLPMPRNELPKPCFKCSDEMLEFYRCFDGLREKAPNRSGAFCLWKDVITFSKSGWGITHGTKEMAEAPIIFDAANGDCIIMNSKGAFIWFNHEEGVFQEFAKSFGEMLTKYVEYRSIGDGHPFDFFGR